jgi:hypothetical protein
MITLAQSKWLVLENALKQEYPPSFMLIRSVQRRELGFVVRRDLKWEKNARGSWPAHLVHLDFYDQSLETWFRLKWADYL